MNDTFTKSGLKPNAYILDNVISGELKNTMAKEGIEFQLVSSHAYHTNLLERETHTFKSHFKAGLVSLDPNFLLTEWGEPIHQAIITLNLLCSARVNPKLSADAYIFGNFNANATPLVPPGTYVIAHIQPVHQPS